MLADRSRQRGEEGGAAPRARPQGSAKGVEKGGTLLPTAQTVPGLGPQPTIEIMAPRQAEQPREETEAEEQARVLAKLREMGKGRVDDEQPR